MNTPDAHSVRALVDRVLGPYEGKPGTAEIARLTDEVLAAGAGLLVTAEPLRATDPRVVGAVRDWGKLTGDGPNAGSPFGGWDYVRGLARVVRTLDRAVEISRRAPCQGSPVPLSFSFGRMPL